MQNPGPTPDIRSQKLPPAILELSGISVLLGVQLRSPSLYSVSQYMLLLAASSSRWGPIAQNQTNTAETAVKVMGM